MNKRFLSALLTGAVMLGLCGCQSGDASLMGNYAAADSVVHSDVGVLVQADFAPLTSQWFLCDVTEEMLTEDYVFDSENPERDGSAFVINRSTNELVMGYRMLSKRYPASITKLMTALLVLKQCDPMDTVTISKEIAALHRGSNAELEEGDQITVSDLLGCLLVVSANNASVALAEHVAGSEEAFVQMMNDEAKTLGLSGTHFANPHGMHDEKHYTTPYDMYVVLQECMKYPEFLKWVTVKKTSYDYLDASGVSKSRTIETTNLFKLGNYELPEGFTILASKTGTTNQASYCLMMIVSNADGEEFIVGVYKAENEEKLYHQMEELLTTYCN